MCLNQKKVILMKHNKSYEWCMLNQTKPIFATHCLQILQGQALGFHTLITLLNSCKDLQFSIATVFNIIHMVSHRSTELSRVTADNYFWSAAKWKLQLPILYLKAKQQPMDNNVRFHFYLSIYSQSKLLQRFPSTFKI